MYRLMGRSGFIRRVSDGMVIPEGHPLWAEYEAWLAAGNTPLPEFTDEQLAALAVEQLESRSRQASAQVSALQGRVDAISDAIELFGDATPEEIAELPVRQSQLTAWKRYRVLLGRVSSQATWPLTPVWPEMPEPYTSEMQSVVAVSV